MFEIKNVDLAGRIGLLETAHGKIETPMLFPVIDIARQEVSLDEIVSLGYQGIITNSYLIYKRFGEEVSSIHELLGFNGVVMTDSGAYQILEYGGIDIDQETILRYQSNINVDIGVILDLPTGDSDYNEAKKTVELTLKRAKEALRIIDPENDTIIWILPIQGGRYLDLIAESSRTALNLPYKMYSIGSPTVFLEKYKYDLIGDMVYTARKILPWGRPLHLFGAGHPLIIPFMVALGVDTFDSASYILYARDNRLMTTTGVYRLENLEYMPCATSICKKYTPRELLELPKQERTKLLAIHNLEQIISTLNEVKQAIKENRLWELLQQYSSKHTAAYSLFRKFRKYHNLLDIHTPSTIANPRGRRLFRAEDFWNPLVTRHLKYLLTVHSSHHKSIQLYPPSDEICRILLSENAYIVLPYFGLVPLPLCRSYPYSQHDTVIPPDKNVCERTAQIVSTFIIKNEIRKIEAVECENIPCWSYIISRLSGKSLELECLSKITQE